MKLLAILALILTLFACSTDNKKQSSVAKETYHNAYSIINKEDIISYSAEAEISSNISNPKEVYKNSTDVAIITILSIDGGSSFNEQANVYCFPYTYGIFRVEKVYKGNMEEGDELQYIRSGGIVSYQEYRNSMSENERKKHDFLSKGKQPEFVEMRFAEDIEIEPGKTYLAYMLNPDSGVGLYSKKDSYVIRAFQGGLREMNINPNSYGGAQLFSSNNNEVTELKVFNNFTNQWENINEVVK